MMKKWTDRRLFAGLAAVLLILSLTGCGQRVESPGSGSRLTGSNEPATERKTEAPTSPQVTVTPTTEKPTEKTEEKPTEKQTETQAATEPSTEPETQRLITSVDYTSKDASVKITLPDNTWKVTQDVDEMRVFKSDDDAIINIVHATTDTAMKGLTVMTSEEDLRSSLDRQYSEESAFDIESFTMGDFGDIRTYRYLVNYHAAARMWAYAMTYAIMAPEEAYVVTGTVTDDNEPLLEAVQKSVQSFRVLNDDELKTVTSEVISGTTRKAGDGVDTDTASDQELTSLQEYGSPVVLVTSDAVNVRDNPGTDADVIAALDQNVSVEVIGETANWFEVSVDGYTGFIRKDFLGYSGQNSSTGSQEASGELSSSYEYGSAATLYATTDVNVRSQPGTDSDIVGGLGVGTPVYVVGETDSWYIVDLGGSTGYVAKDYLDASAPVVVPAADGTQAQGDDTGTVTAGDQAAADAPAGDQTTVAATPDQTSPASYLSGTVTATTDDSITITGTDGQSYTVYYDDSSTVNTQDGLYEGVYVDISLSSGTSGGNTLTASGITGY